MGIVFALSSAIFYAYSNVLARIGVIDVKADKFTGLFMTLLVNFLLSSLATLFLYFTRGLPTLTSTGLIYMILAGIFAPFLGRGTLFLAVDKIGSSRLGALKMTKHVFTVILALVFLREFLPWLSWFAILIVFIGVYVVSEDTKRVANNLVVNEGIPVKENSKIDNHFISYSQRTANLGQRGIDAKTVMTQGILLAMACGLLFGMGNIFRKLAVTYYPEPLLALAVSSGAALLSVFFLQVGRGRTRELISQFPVVLKGQYLWFGVISSLAQFSILTAFVYIPASLGSSIAASEPLFTVIFSFLILGKKELLNWQTVVGTIIVALGVILIVITS